MNLCYKTPWYFHRLSFYEVEMATSTTNERYVVKCRRNQASTVELAKLAIKISSLGTWNSTETLKVMIPN